MHYKVEDRDIKYNKQNFDGEHSQNTVPVTFTGELDGAITSM
jgi:hypothetical protein